MTETAANPAAKDASKCDISGVKLTGDHKCNLTGRPVNTDVVSINCSTCGHSECFTTEERDTKTFKSVEAQLAKQEADRKTKAAKDVVESKNRQRAAKPKVEKGSGDTGGKPT